DDCVLVPLTAQTLLPVDVRLDPVPVANVDRGRTGDAAHARVERVDAPIFELLKIDVERGLVELHDVDAGVGELFDLGSDRVREGERRFLPVFVIDVVQGVDDRHRP